MPHDRRHFLAYFTATGLSSTLLPGVLWGMAQDGRKFTRAMIADAEGIAGLSFNDEQRDQIANGLNRRVQGYEQIRALPITQAIPPALHFDPVPPGHPRPQPGPTQVTPSRPEVTVPDDLEDLAFWPVTHLAELLRTEQVTSVELTEMYLTRLKWFDEQLHCVVTLTEDLALEQAEQADDEISEGKYRGPLHGIPWGAKDLLHTRGIKTTYGAAPFRDQVVDEDATVVERLRDAGAVLVAKLSLGALAMGDVWFKGRENRTRNPWNLKQGSSGSSAGSSSATAAGLVGFAIGTETLGSIVSPCSRCGSTGLRPTYGRVSRAGAMALSWSMDKIGPIGRSAEDCALVFGAIHGKDPRDPTSIDTPFTWDPTQSLADLRVGVVRAAMNGASAEDKATLAVLEGLGITPVDVELPDLPAGAMLTVLNAEAAAAFDEITRDGRVDEMVRQSPDAWPNSFRTARLIPAVEYIQANRARTLLMRAMDEALADVDVFLSPAFGGSTLTITNLTGHPCVVLPNGFRDDGTPTSVTFVGGLYQDDKVLRVAKAYQDATAFHLRHPELPT